MGALLVTATVQCCKANADTLVGAKRQVVAIPAGIILTKQAYTRHQEGSQASSSGLASWPVHFFSSQAELAQGSAYPSFQPLDPLLPATCLPWRTLSAGGF